MDPIMRAHQRHVLGSPRFGANFLYLWALIHPKFGNYESRAIPIAVNAVSLFGALKGLKNMMSKDIMSRGLWRAI